jgi:alkylhydroperoxidase family enzyme
MGVAAAGFGEDKMQIVQTLRPTEKGGLIYLQWSVLRFADVMTSNVQVEDALFDELRVGFTNKETVQITATISAYNCVSRFLMALDVEELNRYKGGGNAERQALTYASSLI